MPGPVPYVPLIENYLIYNKSISFVSPDIFHPLIVTQMTVQIIVSGQITSRLVTKEDICQNPTQTKNALSVNVFFFKMAEFAKVHWTKHHSHAFEVKLYTLLQRNMAFVGLNVNFSIVCGGTCYFERNNTTLWTALG